MHKIKVNRKWTADSVRRVCIDNSLYTLGSNEGYSHMLSWISKFYPDTDHIFIVAEDIFLHSDGQTIENIMFLLENKAVSTTFEIDRRCSYE